MKDSINALYEHQLTEEELNEAQLNLYGYFKTLLEIENEQKNAHKRGPDNDN